MQLHLLLFLLQDAGILVLNSLGNALLSAIELQTGFIDFAIGNCLSVLELLTKLLNFEVFRPQFTTPHLFKRAHLSCMESLGLLNLVHTTGTLRLGDLELSLHVLHDLE